MSSDIVTVSVVGDISLGDFPFCIGYGVGSKIETSGSEFIFENIKERFKESDIVFGNLETIISSNGLKKNDLSSVEMRGDPKSVKGLIDSHFSILNVANNHSLQHGEKAFQETVDTLQLNGIQVCGLACKNHWHAQPVIIEKQGVKFGFLGYAFETDKYYKDELKYAFANTDFIKKDIMNLKKNVDHIMVSCHWGLEFINRPSVSIIRLARQMVDWGAGVILGHHAHVLQGYEKYNDSIIFYGLGNFVFDMSWDQKFMQSMIVNLKINKLSVLDVEICPIIINDSYQPTVTSDGGGEKIIKLIENLSKAICRELEGDTEYNSYTYYMEYEKIRNRNRYLSYLYFLKNIKRANLLILGQIVMRTIRRRCLDLISFFN